MRRVWLRAAALALGAIAVLVGLTVYFSTEKVPPCLVSGVERWERPNDRETHRYEVVLVRRTACVVDMDRAQKLVGYVKLSEVSWLAPAVRKARAAAEADTLTVADGEHAVVYTTERGLLGFRVFDPAAFKRYVVRFKGFTWNPRFGPNPPSHGLSLAPDRPELWVLDAPNSTVHVFDVSGLPKERPRPLGDIRLSKPLSGKENPCSARPCDRIGLLQHSADGRFVYVGDSGDVIDTQTREKVANLEALHNSRVHWEVDFVDGRPVFPARR
jgi:hypothetical protein